MAGDWAKGQNLGHLYNVMFTMFMFLLLVHYLKTIIGMFSDLNHRYPVGFVFIPSWHGTMA